MHRVLLLLALSWCGIAQTAKSSLTSALTFEVASVKIVDAPQSATGFKKGEAGPVQTSANPIRFSRRNATLESMLLLSWPVMSAGTGANTVTATKSS